ncbi:MAG: Cu-processing system permease protein [Phenylobacterium sp.]|jgi:Cu-processing system permease protein
MEQPSHTPTTIGNLLIISRFELVRLFQTTRGLMSIAAFAIIWYFILRYAIQTASQFVGIPGFRESVGEMFGQVGLRNLLDWPVAEFTVFWLFSLFLFPLFSITITADQTSSDRSRGTLRFLTLRTSRDSIFFGRFLGQMMILTLLISGTVTATLLMAVYNNSDNLASSLNSAIIMGINLIIVVMPFTAMMAMFSAAVRSSRLAITAATICWGVLQGLIGYLSYKWAFFEPLSMILPGHQLPDLIQTTQWETLQHSPLPLIQTAVLLLIGRTIVARSSL